MSMSKAPREVLLVGSVPIRPAASVFEIVARHLGGLVKRIPDGEMKGWLRDIVKSHALNPQLEPGGISRLNSWYPFLVQLFQPKDDVSAGDLRLGPYGYAESARESYAEFKRLRDAGHIPLGTRYQLTMPGPGTTAFMIQMEGAKLLSVAAAALRRELDAVFAEIPAEDLTIHLDIAMEAEHDEYMRAPGRFDTPIHEAFDWTPSQMVDAVASVAEHIPSEAELGFHVCSIWHHDPAGGQDNSVLVDAANALAARIRRPIAYFHIPVVPEHDRVEHFEPFRYLKLAPQTKLFLGLLNLSDGLDGARKRIALAETVVADFGISFYCGLGMPKKDMAALISEIGIVTVTPELENQVRRSSVPLLPRAKRNADDPSLARATEDTIGRVLDLHRQAAFL